MLLLPRLLSKLFSIDLLFRIYEFLTYFISTSSISSVLTGLKSSFVEVICPLLAVLIYVFLGFSDICLFYGDGDLSSKLILIFYITGTIGFGIFASMISCSSFCWINYSYVISVSFFAFTAKCFGSESLSIEFYFRTACFANILF